jgi:hypothetical protein
MKEAIRLQPALRVASPSSRPTRSPAGAAALREGAAAHLAGQAQAAIRMQCLEEGSQGGAQQGDQRGGERRRRRSRHQRQAGAPRGRIGGIRLQGHARAHSGKRQQGAKRAGRARVSGGGNHRGGSRTGPDTGTAGGHPAGRRRTAAHLPALPPSRRVASSGVDSPVLEPSPVR